MTNKPPVFVDYTSTFRKNLKRLRKKYPHIRNDIEPLIAQLQNGEIPGDRIPGTGHPVYKVRLPNRDAQRGKSGGYRVIYYVRTAQQVILLTIYTKSERADIDSGEIQNIVDDLSNGDTET